jgi:deoxyribodipyrimidine photo-lyase
MVNSQRILKLNTLEYKKGPIVYWMSRDMRVRDNWALVYAQEVAKRHKTGVIVVYNLVTSFLGGSDRHLMFKCDSLLELDEDLTKLGISLSVVIDESSSHSSARLIDFFEDCDAGAVITDFSPLKISQKWVKDINQKIIIPFFQVDAHNIVPCWVTSEKQEFGARTIRPKLHRLIPQFLEEFPNLTKQSLITVPKKYGVKKITNSIPKTNGLMVSGERAAKQRLKKFFDNHVDVYDIERNDPNSNAQSGMSPYLHYGQIAAQRIILELLNHLNRKDVRSVYENAFFEEIVIRRELSDNFCYYNDNYDNPKGFANWAQKTWAKHAHDSREYVYTLKQFEQGKTHDDLWNAAQIEMVTTGKMHGYMRMYWAKKILEWTPDPETAMKIAITLNNRYELDGRDPNGYAGIAWSIGGIHDRAWFERPIFGQIRYMNANGCASKFDTKQYINNYLNKKS